MSKIIDMINNLKDNVIELEDRLKLSTNEDIYGFKQVICDIMGLHPDHNDCDCEGIIEQLKNREEVYEKYYDDFNIKEKHEELETKLEASLEEIEALRSWGKQIFFEIRNSVLKHLLIEKGLLKIGEDEIVLMNVDNN
eukprot:SAG11_NODE_228_length_11986_cov_128.901153_9_plen_138_part_00